MELEKLLRCGQVLTYREGEIVRYQGDPMDEVLILLEGVLRTEYVSENGKVLEVDTIKPVQIVASGLVFSGDPRFPVNVTAGSEAKILTVPKDRFLELLMEDREFLIFFLEDISEHFRILSEKLFFLITKTLKEKVVHYLVHHMNENGEVVLPVSVEELSRIFGCARPALSRVFQELTREGYIEKRGRRIRILRNPLEDGKIQ
ncbi:Crp/Fnr family transcriptional regulator [Thermotoga sp.]|uniref:Crp/Fnr family transcriptional regulator n=1 Tax=Thermotoga sp. TaxID=28240 RepID=UPI0025E24A94|nr:Crp/Fnr family transcriptional regulator [Thermotoga sp.]MCD6551300.1 Crp/Fnr family transcriptional regulator [Thermotoga sp.]